jgi:hypothetical protein
MTIEVTTAAGITRQEIDITKRAQAFTITTNAAPTSIKIDSLEQIPLKVLKQSPVVTARR